MGEEVAKGFAEIEGLLSQGKFSGVKDFSKAVVGHPCVRPGEER